MKNLLPKNFVQPHPEVLKKIDPNQRFISATILQPEEVNGQRICPWCLTNPIPSEKRKYCSEECKNSCYAVFSPASLRGLIMARCEYQCQKCHFDYFPYFKKVQAHFSEMIKAGKMNYPAYIDLLEFPEGYPNSWFFGWMTEFLKQAELAHKMPEIDHIQALGLGGSGIFFDNLQVLCHECHAIKTRVDVDLILRQKYEKLREDDSSPKD